MTESYAIHYSVYAVEDLAEIHMYVKFRLRAPIIAQNLTERLRGQIRRLDALPERHPLVEWEPWKSRGIRKFPIGNFVAFYSIDEASHTVMILHIYYGGRDIRNLATE